MLRGLLPCLTVFLVSLDYSIVSGQKKPVTVDAILSGTPAPASAITWSPDGRFFTYTQSGKVHLYDVASATARELFSVASVTGLAVKVPTPDRFAWENRRVREPQIQWSPDGHSLLVSLGGDLFLWKISAGGLTALTQTATAERDAKFSPDGRLIAFRREHDLCVLRVADNQITRLTTNGSETLLNGELDWVYPEELALGSAFWWSGDSTRIAWLQFDVSREPLYPHADLLGSRAVFEPQRYPKAGDPNAAVRLGVTAASGGPTRWMDVGDTEWNHLTARVTWLGDNRRLLVQRLNRIQNRLDVLTVDAATGEAATLLKETDPYWINLPPDPVLMKDGERFVWSSERGSYRHLYLHSLGTVPPIRLTSGDWEVKEVNGVDERKGLIYFTSAEVSPLESHLYSVGFDGSGKTKITSASGMHRISMSPTAEYYVDLFTSKEVPWRQSLHRSDGRQVSIVAEAGRKQVDEYDVLPAEIVKLRTADGQFEMFARVIRPVGFTAGKQYPAVVDVYGGPHAQSVLNAWDGVSFRQVLAHRGFVVIQIDNRGTHGRGHTFETPVFRRLGMTEVADQKAGLEQIIAMGFVDPARVGIMGWSYGGFMTLNCMLNAPGTFRAGIAGAPVTSFANYDSIYTERYMGLPADNAGGYMATDMTKLAGKLQGKLMLLDNFEDDNVLFQNMLQMTHALQTAGKQFSFMIYPQKTHGVTGPVRKHMYEAMLTFLERELK